MKKKKQAKGKAKTSRKRSGVKDLTTKKAATVRGGLPAVQKVRDAAARFGDPIPTASIRPGYLKI